MGRRLTVKHLKARHTEPKDLLLEFDRRTQRFTELCTRGRRERKNLGG